MGGPTQERPLSLRAPRQDGNLPGSAHLPGSPDAGGTTTPALSSAEGSPPQPPPPWDAHLRYGLALAAVGLVAMLAVYQLSDNLYVHSMTAQVGLIFGLAVSAATTPSRP